MRGIVGVCGTPGTGKKTVAPFVADLLGLPAPMPLNSLAPKGTADVDVQRLRRALLKLDLQHAVLFGHLLPHVVRRNEARSVAVLRCEPFVLRGRLVSRGYAPAKVTENVEAELIGVVLDECVRRFGVELVREYDTTSASPKKVAKAIARDAGPAKGSERRRGTPNWIDWTLDYGSPGKLRSLLTGGSETPAST